MPPSLIVRSFRALRPLEPHTDAGLAAAPLDSIASSRHRRYNKRSPP